jgi:hypothetical protein
VAENSCECDSIVIGQEQRKVLLRPQDTSDNKTAAKHEVRMKEELQSNKRKIKSFCVEYSLLSTVITYNFSALL